MDVNTVKNVKSNLKNVNKIIYTNICKYFNCLPGVNNFKSSK